MHLVDSFQKRMIFTIEIKSNIKVVDLNIFSLQSLELRNCDRQRQTYFRETSQIFNKMWWLYRKLDLYRHSEEREIDLWEMRVKFPNCLKNPFDELLIEVVSSQQLWCHGLVMKNVFKA